MKKIYQIIVCASLALLSVACNNQAEQSLDMAQNEGVLALNIDFESTRADVDPAAEFELKIYRYAADSSKELHCSEFIHLKWFTIITTTLLNK